jgi:hypothetical protein
MILWAFMPITHFNQGLCALLMLGAVTPHLLAADIGKGEVFGQGGYYTELGQGGGTWAIVGGGAGVNLGQRLALFGEFNYVRPTTTFGGVSATGSLYQAGGGARIFIPVHTERFRPYVPLVGGLIRARAAVEVNGVEYQHEWESGAYVGAGFGSEIGITKRFGLRPEFRYFREFWYPQYGQSSQNDGLRLMVGVYYRLGVR